MYNTSSIASHCASNHRKCRPQLGSLKNRVDILYISRTSLELNFFQARKVQITNPSSNEIIDTYIKCSQPKSFFTFVHEKKNTPGLLLNFEYVE